jgi:hypothetical protein
MGQGIGVGEEDRAAGLIEDGNVVAREGGCCVGDGQQAPDVKRIMHDVGGRFSLMRCELGFKRQTVGVLFGGASWQKVNSGCPRATSSP